MVGRRRLGRMIMRSFPVGRSWLAFRLLPRRDGWSHQPGAPATGPSRRWRSGLVNSFVAGIIALGLLASSIASASAQEEPQAKQRLEFMQAAVASLEPEASDAKSKAALAVVPKPLLRYNDPTRGGVL